MRKILIIVISFLCIALYSNFGIAQTSTPTNVLSTETPAAVSDNSLETTPKPAVSAIGGGVQIPNLRADDKKQGHQPHGAELLGILPGKTTYADLLASPTWKTPGAREVVDGFLVLTYKIQELPEMPFIQIFIQKDIVQGVVIHLKDARELEDAKKAFEAATKRVRTITMKDSEGFYRTIFPEKGLAFVLEKSKDSDVPTSRVIRIVVETVNPDYYIIRAEESFDKSLTNAFSDAEHALLHEKNKASAYWIMARAEHLCGRNEKAREHALQAVKIDQEPLQYQLTLIQILLSLGQTKQGEKLLEVVLPRCGDDPLFQGESLILQGNLAREKTPADYDQAIDYHQQAIEKIKGLLADTDQERRIAAKRLAIKAHLELAIDIARKEWTDQKDQELAFQWLNAAGTLADDLIKKEETDVIPLWEVCVAAMEVGLNLPDADMLDEYIRTLRRLSGVLLTEKSRPDDIHPKGDTLALKRVEYFTGKSLFDAMLIYKARKDYESAVACGERSLELLEKSLEQSSVREKLILGTVMFHLGAIAADDPDESKLALDWFDKAVKIFDKAEGKLDAKESTKVGKLLVNISLFRWKNGDKEEACAMTEKGTSMIEKGLKEGIGKKADLFVPYSNLATMHKSLNHIKEAEKFAALAKQSK